MAGIGISVKELDACIRAVHHGVINAAADTHGAHRYRRVGDALGEREQIRRDVEARCRERRAKTPEAGDDLVEDKQDTVTIADLPNALEISLRWNEDAR